MKNRDGLENSDNWATPKWLYDQLNAEFHFDFDPCPLNHNIEKWNGLEVDWGKSNFCNPPYNRIDKPKFIKKAYDEWKKGKTCVLLIPAATGTKQFHELMLPNAEIRFLKGRVNFAGVNTKGEYSTKNKGKHDSMVVIFRAGLRSEMTFTTKRYLLSADIGTGEDLSAVCIGSVDANGKLRIEKNLTFDYRNLTEEERQEKFAHEIKVLACKYNAISFKEIMESWQH